MPGGGQDPPARVDDHGVPAETRGVGVGRDREDLVVLSPGPGAHLDQVLVVVADRRGDHEDLGARERLGRGDRGKGVLEADLGPEHTSRCRDHRQFSTGREDRHLGREQV